MNIFLKNTIESLNVEGIDFVISLQDADSYEYRQFTFNDDSILKKTLFVQDEIIYWLDITKIRKKYWDYFILCPLSDTNRWFKILYYFTNLSGIALFTYSQISKLVTINSEIFSLNQTLSTKDFLQKKVSIQELTLIKNDILVPDNLIVNESLYKIYSLLETKLTSLEKKWDDKNIFFEDIILSLLPEKYWINSLFYLNSKIKFKISRFFNTYNDIISLHIPVARSQYLEDLFESLLLQTNTNFKICIGVDGYNKEQKKDIIKIIKTYQGRFDNFDFFINKRNLWVGKTRWKLLNWDKTSKYIVFLDDDNFLSVNMINDLYKKIDQFKKCWMYSIANIDIRFDTNYKDFIHKVWPFEQPSVYTNRERVNRLPLYCNQEETPLIHNRFYSDLLDIKYHETFDSCSVDMVFNRFLEIICWNTNFDWIYQFMRVWHQYHQTRTNGFEEKEFRYVMYILQMISYLNNNNYYFTYLIKTLVPKQNELFTKK